MNPAIVRAARVAFAVLGGAGWLSAQEIRVRVSEPGGPNLAVGVLVSLERADGSNAARGVTSDFGRVRLMAPAGSYLLRVERPGFADTTATVAVTPVLDSLTIGHAARRAGFPTRLVPVPASCRTPGITEAVALHWAQARVMLRTVEATEDRAVTTQSLAAFERVVSGSLKIESEELNTLLDSANRPAQTASPAERARVGYLVRAENLWSTPDLTVFLSPEFTTSHCFGIVSGIDNRSGFVGLRFEPAASDRVDVAGTMWLDPLSRELKVIDYRFTGAPAEWRPDRLGGSAEFHRSEAGFWVTRFWYQRTPVVDPARGRFRHFREVGAEVVGVTPTVDTTDRVATAQAIVVQERAIRERVARIEGQVTDTLGYPVPEAEVLIMGTEFQTQSDRTGRFFMDGLPPGLQIARVRKVGYKAQYFTIRLAGGQQWDGKIAIRRLPQFLGDILVIGKYGKPPQYANTAKYDEFYRRRSKRVGKFLTREEIDKLAAGRISELLRGIPGVRSSFIAPGEPENVSFLNCPSFNVSVWIDGQKMTGNVGEVLPLITPSDIEAIEVYQRQTLIPPEYRDNSCGAIVMWTR
ncbi:MAG: hypothetical protein EXR94_06165 [Gemmatimonadetes bacterium]|nr:hypothetical protein [Gemmatimonadota bacterium]